ncbi:MAG: xanthine dehydrogenase family protein molybdopterin-binding subunit [Nitrososphaerales archaeon]
MVKRKEDHVLLLGRAGFIDDLKSGAYAMLLRSPYAHARILKIDKTAALKLKGVIGVLDSASIEGKYVPFAPAGDLIKAAVMHPLAKGKVRYIGEPVAIVLAENRYIAEDALELIEVEYEVLSVLVNADDAISSKTLLHDEWGTNVAIRQSESSGDIDAAFSDADEIIRERIKMHRHSGTPIETRGIVASYNPYTKELTVWSSTQLPHIYRSLLSGALRLDENLIRTVAVNTGGSYGTKTVGYQEDVLIPLLSTIYGMPVKWIETREESFKATVHGREQTHDIEIAVKSDGTILGIKDRVVVDLGAYVSRAGFVEAFNSAALIPGCYRFQNFSFELYGVVTDKTPLGPYRGFGKSGPSFVIERMMDIVAKKIKIDPAEIRRKNLVEKFPHRNPAGPVYDSGDYQRCLELALEMADYENMRMGQEEKREKGEYIGIGISCSLAPTGIAIKNSPMSPYDVVTLRVTREGKITAITGACGLNGTSHETTISQIVAETIGINQSDVIVLEGDTSISPIGQGTFSDRSAVYTASAAKIASEKLRKKILEVASGLLGSQDLTIENGVIRSKDKSTTIQNIAREVYLRPYMLPKNIEAGLEVTHYFSIRDFEFYTGDKGLIYYPCYSNDCNIAIVQVDVETGKIKLLKYISVNDCGTIINKDIVEGQIQGGTMAGIGGAIYEEFSYDAEGQLLGSSFMDYLVPTAMEAPEEFFSKSIETPSPLTVLGSKGVGESGTIGVYGALANAVADALAPFGASITALPLKPESIRASIKKGA